MSLSQMAAFAAHLAASVGGGSLAQNEPRRLLMPLTEYNRIYQVARGTIRDIGNPEVACMFFNSFGAYVLNKHYRIPARVVAGAFGLCVGDTPDVLFFGNQDEGSRLTSASDGFHMWVQTETHIVDFMAPIFPETFAHLAGGLALPRKMLQRPITTEAQSVADLQSIGDFITLPDLDLTKSLVDDFFAKPANEDLLRVAEAWFGSRLGKQKPRFKMQNDLGEIYDLTLPRSGATGAW